jgi:hypothetical protein
MISSSEQVQPDWHWSHYLVGKKGDTRAAAILKTVGL